VSRLDWPPISSVTASPALRIRQQQQALTAKPQGGAIGLHLEKYRVDPQAMQFIQFGRQRLLLLAWSPRFRRRPNHLFRLNPQRRLNQCAASGSLRCRADHGRIRERHRAVPSGFTWKNTVLIPRLCSLSSLAVSLGAAKIAGHPVSVADQTTCSG
jgi:hypothetical protein